MHATIRRYEGVDTTRMNEVAGKVKETLVPQLRELPGFSGYYLLEAEPTPPAPEWLEALRTDWPGFIVPGRMYGARESPAQPGPLPLCGAKYVRARRRRPGGRCAQRPCRS